MVAASSNLASSARWPPPLREIERGGSFWIYHMIRDSNHVSHRVYTLDGGFKTVGGSRGSFNKPFKRDTPQLRKRIKTFLKAWREANLRSKQWGGINAEDVALQFQVKPHVVKQIFHELNREGLFYQKTNSGPHDSHRDYSWSRGPWDSCWISSYYLVKG